MWNETQTKKNQNKICRQNIRLQVFINQFVPMHQPPKLTCGDQSELVLLICHFLLLHVSPREEEAHHPLEELVHQLDGERHHVHLTDAPNIRLWSISSSTISSRWDAAWRSITSKCSFTEIPPTGGRTLLKMRSANWRPDWQVLWGRSTTCDTTARPRHLKKLLSINV